LLICQLELKIQISLGESNLHLSYREYSNDIGNYLPNDFEYSNFG